MLSLQVPTVPENKNLLHLQFWQNLLSELVGFPLDGSSNRRSGISTSVTAMVSISSVVVSYAIE